MIFEHFFSIFVMSVKKPNKKTKKMKRGAHRAPLTVEEIVADPIAQLAVEHWGDDSKGFSLDVVQRLFDEVLQPGLVHRVALLEASKYLEG